MGAFAAPASIPPRGGVGFKLPHTGDILAEPGRIGFVEIHAENFMGAGGPPHHMLARVRNALPVSLPTGVVTGAVGAPYLIWLLATVNREGRGG